MTRLGYDHVVGYHTFSFPIEHGMSTEDTAAGSTGQRNWQDEQEGPIQTWEGFETYDWPRIEDASFEDIEKLGPMLPGNMKVTATLPGGVLENLCRLMGYAGLCYALIDDPPLVQAVVDKIGEREMAVYRALCGIDHVGALWFNDDDKLYHFTGVSASRSRSRFE